MEKGDDYVFKLWPRGSVEGRSKAIGARDRVQVHMEEHVLFFIDKRGEV